MSARLSKAVFSSDKNNRGQLILASSGGKAISSPSRGYTKSTPSGGGSFNKEMDDKDLEAEIENASGQLRFENFWSRVGKFFKFAIAIFILLGVTGLLLFGIRQLF